MPGRQKKNLFFRVFRRQVNKHACFQNMSSMIKVKRKTPNGRFIKAATGIRGLDVVTNGGIPKNRSTLLLGNTGCGKTIMAMQFLVRGIELFDDPAVFISFEEKTDELEMNVESLGFNLGKHIADNKLHLEHVLISRPDLPETGNYDIEGLFLRLSVAIAKVKAKRVVLDSLDTLFYNFSPRILRPE